MDTTPVATIALYILVCRTNIRYVARFATEDQAIAFVERKSATCNFEEVETEQLDYDRFPRLCDALYPTCEHGLSLSQCYGPQHYYMDDEERYFAGV